MLKLSRIFTACTRIAKCGEKLGWHAAFKAYFLARLLGRSVTVHLHITGTDFHLRGGALDLGSFASFYLGYPYVPTKRIKTILDGGANIGDSAVLFSCRYAPKLIVAAEPDGENFALLKRNTAELPAIRPVNCALWSHDTTVKLTPVLGSTVSSSVTSNGKGCFVAARSISSLAREFGLESFDLVKLDVEGAEREILQSNPSEWLNGCLVFILELHDHLAPGAGTALIRAVNECGPFQIRQVGEYLVFLRCGAGEELHLYYEV